MFVLLLPKENLFEPRSTRQAHIWPVREHTLDARWPLVSGFRDVGLPVARNALITNTDFITPGRFCHHRVPNSPCAKVKNNTGRADGCHFLLSIPYSTRRMWCQEVESWMLELVWAGCLRRSRGWRLRNRRFRIPSGHPNPARRSSILLRADR
jgi:hypothetical protein